MSLHPDCEWFALLECFDEATTQEVAQHFQRSRHQTMSGGGGVIILCEVEFDERMVRVYFNGECMVGYSVFYSWAEEQGSRVALIRVADSLDDQPYDPLDVELLEDGYEQAHYTDYYQKCAQKLVKKFVTKVNLGSYSADSLMRLVRMCLLREDLRDAVGQTYQLLCDVQQKGPPHYNYWGWWNTAIDACCTCEKDGYTPGSSLLVRVMAHLVYLEECVPTGKSPSKKIRQMSLF